MKNYLIVVENVILLFILGTPTKILLFLFLLLPFIGIASNPSCQCTEYLYLNETTNNGAMHKFKINSDTTFTEIGNPWYQNPPGGDFTTPHGLGIDQNGFIYVGESVSNGEIRKFDCDGNIFPESNFAISNGGQTNIVTLGNTLYANDWKNDEIKKWDICTATQLGTAEFCNGVTNAWGFYHDEYTDRFYATSSLGNEPNDVYVFDDSDFDTISTTCITGLNLSNLPPNAAEVGGITLDPLGNLYVVVRNDGGGSYLIKYGPAPNYNYIRTSAIDNSEDGVGWNRAMGIVYSKTINMLLVSTRSPDDDCVALFDTTLTYVEAAIPPTGTDTQAKGASLIKECCPTNSNFTIDTTLCGASINEEFFLRQFFNCEGTICAGLWQEGINNSGLTYNSCNNSITIDSLEACGAFSLTSDGSSTNSQCGAFSITVNVSTLRQPTVSVTGDQTYSCPIGTFSTITATTNADAIQWQMSTTSCTAGFTDIVGETNAAYTPSGLTDTTYFRVKVFNNGSCMSSNCEETSACVTVNVEENCCTNPMLSALTAEDICFGDNFSSVMTSVSNGVAVTYQWYNDNGTNNTGTAAISGETTASLTALPTAAGSYLSLIHI